MTFPVPCDASVELDGIRVLALPKWVELKVISGRLSGRRRDWADIQDVIRTLVLPRDFSDLLEPTVREEFCRLWDEAQAETGDY